MRPDARDGLTPVDYGCRLTPREELDVLWAADPRRDWPSRREAEEDARRPAVCVTSKEEPNESAI